MSVCIRDTAFSQHCAKEVGPICSAEEMRKIPDTHIPRAFKKLLKVLRFTNLLKVPINNLLGAVSWAKKHWDKHPFL